MNALTRYVAALALIPLLMAGRPATAQSGRPLHDGAPVRPAATPVIDLPEAGLVVTLPDHWKATREGSRVLLNPEDQSLAVVIAVSDKIGVDRLVAEIRSNQQMALSDVRTTAMHQTEVNGLPVRCESGTARGSDGPAVWSLRVLEASQPVVLYTLGSPHAMRIHERDYQSLLASLRKSEPDRT